MPDYRVDVFVGEQAATDFHARNAALAQLSNLYGGVTITKTMGGWLDHTNYPVREYGRCFTVILTEDESAIQAEARDIVDMLGAHFPKERELMLTVTRLDYGKSVPNESYEGPDE